MAPDRPLAALEPLIGEWTMEAVLGGQTVSGGTMTCEWFDDGAFLVQRADAELPDGAPPEFMEHSPFPTVTVIGFDDAFGSYSMLYSDARGVRRVYQMSFEDGVWRLWRDAPGFPQRFEGTLSEDGQTIAGRWEKSTDGSEWQLDFELAYRRAA